MTVTASGISTSRLAIRAAQAFSESYELAYAQNIS